MKVTTLDETVLQGIGHAFGYYDYGDEAGGLVNAFPSRDAAAACSIAVCSPQIER